MDVPHYRTKTCTPVLSSTENDLSPRKLLRSAVFCNLARHRIPMPAITCLLGAPHTRTRSAPPTSLQTRRSEGDRPKQKHSRGRKKQQHAVSLIHLPGEGDHRLPRSPNRLLLDPAPSNDHRRRPHHLRHTRRTPIPRHLNIKRTTSKVPNLLQEKSGARVPSPWN